MTPAAVMTPSRPAFAGLDGIGIAVALALGLALWLLARPTAAAPPDLVSARVESAGGTPLFAMPHEVTVAEWNLCADAGGCALRLTVRRPGTEAVTPATGLNWFDVTEYVGWISARSGQPLRLPTLAEWQAMAAEVLPEAPKPIFTDPQLGWASSYLLAPPPRALRPQGSFRATEAGIADLTGPVWEWTSDCFAPDLAGPRCPAYFVAGEHVAAIPVFTRDPARGGCAMGAPPAHLGLRLVSDRAPPLS